MRPTNDNPQNNGGHWTLGGHPNSHSATFGGLSPEYVLCHVKLALPHDGFLSVILVKSTSG
jgi:hypothetical protein